MTVFMDDGDTNHSRQNFMVLILEAKGAKSEREREMGFEVTEECLLGVFFSLASAGSLLLSLLFFFSLDVSSCRHTAH